jgi:CHAT domain-containing protein
MNRAIALRALGQHREAVAGYADARRALRRARQLGRMDETSLKFGDEWARLYRFSVDTALAAGHPDQAHEAVCNGKAGLIGDLWLRQHEWAIDEPAEVGETRFDLTDWMRNCVPVLEQGKSTPLPSEIVHYQMQVQNYLTGRDERTRTSITTWGQAHHAYSADRPLPQDKETTLADIQGCLPADWALIDFWRTANEEFTAFALFRDRLHVQKLPFPYERLKEQLDLFVATLRSNNRDDADLGMLNELYTYLFLLLRRMLKEHDIQGLYLVPHDFLHLLPLHAARIGEPPVYLCDEYAIAYLPTASLLPRLPELSLDGSAFIVANPEVGTEATLPFSHWEGLQLHKRFSSGDTCCHLGKAGTFAATGDWSQAGLVHFTCHGMGDDRFSPRSHLRLADDLLLAHDVLYRRPPLQKGAMVVLNGCETSVPDMRSINESLGLMSAFLVKGAGLVLSTQWSVADSCAAGMVLTFVDQVRAGARPAEALKTAQKEVRKLKAPAILARTDEVARLFPKGSHEHAKLQVNRAWVCLRAGMIDEARQAAEEARVPLRNLGLMREAQSLYRTLDETRSPGFKPVKARLESFDSPVYWGAFQLVGRVV